ncbi:MAG: Rid family hydrolase [SAR202 cluster bacterium]|nr:Rid family hydrolase [SAR202 cluster bacterium]MDP6798425.1 Rid family hydrolase [SAR202 cluster bacterium]
MNRRISISSIDEETYGSSGAMLVGDRLFVSGVSGSGVTAGEQFGDGAGRIRDVIAELDAAPEDIVRTRVFYTNPSDHDALGLAHGEAFGSVRPAMSLTQVHFLPDEAKVVVEAEAIRNSTATAVRVGGVPNAEDWGYAGAVRAGADIWVSGVTAQEPGDVIHNPGNVAAQSRWVSNKVIAMIGAVGHRPADIVSTRHYTAVAYAGVNTVDERLRIMHPHHPTSAGITVQGLGDRRLAEMIEVEAVVGAAESRVNVNSGRPYEEDHHYSRSVRAGDVVYVSGTTSVQLDEEVGSPFDAYGQTLETLAWIRWGIEQQGLSFRDTVRTRSYGVGQENLAPVARGLREILGEFRPASTVVGGPTLGRPSILVEIEATAVRGASPN